MSTKNTLKLFLVGSIAAMVLSACGQPEANDQAELPPAAPEVSVAQVVSERITEWDEFTGRLQAPETVQIVPRVSGYIEKVLFTEAHW